MFLSEVQKGGTLVAERHGATPKGDGVGHLDYAPLVRAICDGARAVTEAAAAGRSWERDRRLRLQMALSFLLICMCQEEIARLRGPEEAEAASEALRVAMAGRACGILFPEADKVTAEYFLLLYEADFQLCCREMTRDGAGAEEAARAWLAAQPWDHELRGEIMAGIEGLWRNRCLPIIEAGRSH